jgi:Lectin C-type domain
MVLIFLPYNSDPPALVGGGTSDSCSNNISDTKIQMINAVSGDTFGQIGFVNPKQAVLNVAPFQKTDSTEATNYLCEKINEYTCNAGSFLFDGACYTLILNQLTHAQADYNCRLLGGQLLQIRNRKQQTFINAAFPAQTSGYVKIWLDYRKVTYNPADLSFRAADDTVFVFNSSGVDFTYSAPELNDPLKNCVAMDSTQGDFNGWKTLSCFENASFICQQPQVLSPSLVRIIPKIQLLLPLDLYSGFADLALSSRTNIANMVAISTDQYLPSGLVGAAHFLGNSDSVIRIDNGGTKGIRSQFGISVSMWIYIDLMYDGETQVLIDARPDCISGSEVDEGFTLSLVKKYASSISSPPTNSTCSALSQMSVQSANTSVVSVKLVAKLCTYNNSSTKCDNFISPSSYNIPVKQWTSIGFTYNAVSKLGSFFIGPNYGYYDKTVGSNVINGYFSYDSGNWLTNSSSVAVNAPIQIGSSKYGQSTAFSGKLSCLQWYEGPITHPQFVYLSKCPVNNTYQGKSSLCPQGFEYYKKNCYKFATKAQDFATAEAYCTSPPGKGIS